MKKLLLAAVVIMVMAGCACAYTVSREVFVAAGGVCSNSAYSTFVSLSDGFVSGEGEAPAPTPTQEANPPTVTDLLFDGRAIINNDYVKSDTTITANVTDDSGSIDTAQSRVELDSTYVYFNNLPAGSTFTGGVLTYRPALANGTHTIKIVAYDPAGKVGSTETVSFKVQGGAADIDGVVLNYPNPFNPAAGQTTEINYILTADANITIYIYNIIGHPIKRINCPAGSEGGHAGYNRVTWNGYNEFSELVANDVYIARVVLNGKQIGKCKIAVLK